MRVVDEIVVFGKLKKSADQALSEIRTSIKRTKIIINPTPKGNGVNPIRHQIIENLKKIKWSDEHPMDLAMMRSRPLDAFKRFKNFNVGLEWETGNVSSSFRALMKLIKGLDENQLDLGVHVLPSRAFYKYLTDRVGNITELLPYLKVFGKINIDSRKTLMIIVVEYDEIDHKAKLIPKGFDGMSLSCRKISKKKR